MKVLRTSTYRSLLSVTAASDFSMKIGAKMPLAEVAAHTVYLGECRGMVTNSLGLEDPQKIFV